MLDLWLPWAIRTSTFQWLKQLSHQPLTINASPEGRNPAGPFPGQEGIAVVRVSGILMADATYLRRRGIEATSYSEIAEAVDQALADPAVKQIHLSVNSPGGQVANIASAISVLWKARQSKKLTAHIEHLGTSGAYWLASQAETISAAKLAEIGSIGVFCVYHDTSKANEKAGRRIVVIRSGESKAIGLDKISDNQLAGVQKLIDGIRNNSIKDIARGRGKSENRIWQLATGRTWIADAALELGLIDEVDRSPGMD